jgi:two-component system, sensor histidine kinase and response regulator
MMTAFETTDTIRQALRLRACDYINKPFDIATMRAAVGQAMQRRMLESEIHSSAEKVQELLAELQNQRVEEQIAKTRGDIYASIIHDINGPLTVISGFVQVLNQRLNRLAAGAGGFGIHQGPAAHHRAAGGQLHRDFPALPRFSAPPDRWPARV